MIKFALAILLIVGIYAGIQPYRTVQNLTQALENEDVAKVDQYVDFETVKKSLGDDFAKRKNLDQGKPNSVGAMLATSIAATFLKGIVSPETMVTILKDKSRRDRMGFSSSFGEVVGRGAWLNDKEFVLRNDDDQPTALLTRNGLKWEVTALRF